MKKQTKHTENKSQTSMKANLRTCQITMYQQNEQNWTKEY